MVALDETDTRQFWFADLGRGDAPVPLEAEFPANVQLGPEGRIFYADGTDENRSVYRVNEDGSNLEQVLDVPIIWLEDVSADGQWLTARISHGKYRLPGVPDHEPEGFMAVGTSVWAYSVENTSEPRLLCNDCFWAIWGPNERYMYFQTGADPSIYATSRQTTHRNLYRIPIR